MCFLIAAFFILFNPLLADEEIRLSLKDCIAIALDQNPSARAAEFGLVMAEENIGIAKAPYYPILRFNTEYHRFRQHLFFPKINSPVKIPSFIGPLNDYNYHVSTQYILYDFGRRRAQLLEAKSRREAAREELVRIEQEIVLNVSLAYYSLLASQENLHSAQLSLKRYEDHQRLAQEKKQSGETPLSDILKSQVNTANSKQNLSKHESNVRIAIGNLNVAIGLPPETLLAISQDHSPLIPPDSFDLCDALNQAILNRPEVNALLFQMEAVKNQIKVLQGDLGPRLTAEALYGRRDSKYFPHDDEFAFGFTFDFELFKGFGTYYQIQKAKAELNQAMAHYDQAVLKVKQDVWNAYSSLVEAYENIKTAEVQVNDAKESLRHAKERYKVGAGTIADLLDAETAYTTSESMVTDAHWNYHSAYRLFLWAKGE